MQSILTFPVGLGAVKIMLDLFLYQELNSATKPGFSLRFFRATIVHVSFFPLLVHVCCFVRFRFFSTTPSKLAGNFAKSIPEIPCFCVESNVKP